MEKEIKIKRRTSSAIDAEWASFLFAILLTLRRKKRQKRKLKKKERRRAGVTRRDERKQFLSLSLSYCTTQWANWVFQVHWMFLLPVFIVNVMPFVLLFSVSFSVIDPLLLWYCIFYSVKSVCLCVYAHPYVCVPGAILGSHPLLFLVLFFCFLRNLYMNGFSFAFHFAPMLIILTCEHALLHYHRFLFFRSLAFSIVFYNHVLLLGFFFVHNFEAISCIMSCFFFSLSNKLRSQGKKPSIFYFVLRLSSTSIQQNIENILTISSKWTYFSPSKPVVLIEFKLEDMIVFFPSSNSLKRFQLSLPWDTCP